MTTLKISIHDILLTHFGTAVLVPATVQIAELLDFACDDDEHEIDVNEYLERQREIAIIWGVEDVLSVRPDLSEDQAWEVLKLAHGKHDANYGINWESLEASAEALYGFADESDSGKGGDDE